MDTTTNEELTPDWGDVPKQTPLSEEELLIQQEEDLNERSSKLIEDICLNIRKFCIYAIGAFILFFIIGVAYTSPMQLIILISGIVTVMSTVIIIAAIFLSIIIGTQKISKLIAYQYLKWKDRNYLEELV